MMTGNVLFLGFGLAGSAGSSVAEPAVAVATFLLGGALGGTIAAARVSRERHYLGAAISLEAALLAAATLFAALVTVRSGEAAGIATIAVLAFAMGARNTIVRRIGVPELPTTVLTVAVSSLRAGTGFAGASPEHLVPRAAAVVVMLVGALAGALLVKTSLALALGAAAVLTLLAGVALATAATRADVAEAEPG